MALSDKLEAKLDELTAYPRADEAEYTPRTEFDYATGGYIQTGPLREEPKNYDELLVTFGYDPAEVAIVGHPRISRWQQRARIRGTAEYETTWLCAYKFQIAAKGAASSALDLEGIVKRARKAPKTGTGPHWFVFQASDLQIGKRAAAGGTEEIIECYLNSVEAAREEFKSAKRLGIEGIQISYPGDCVEGAVSQSGRNLGYLTESGVPEQVRVLRRLMLHTIEAFAPLVDRVVVTTVNGNHDQAQRVLNSYPGDGWATEAAIAVDDALKLNPAAYGHVQMLVPDQWQGYMTVPLGDDPDTRTIVTVAHGHQWRRGKGMDWWAGQAHAGHPAGGAHILQCGHYHSWHVESQRNKVLIQSSTFDTGSDYFREKYGVEARRGGLVYLLNAGEVTRMSLV